MTRFLTEYLAQEHYALSHLLNKLQEQLQVLPLRRDMGDSLARLRGLSRKISSTLHRHLEEEERILYPALEDHVQGVGSGLERMRREQASGEAAEQAFLECVERLAHDGRSRREVMQAGRKYIQWLRSYLLQENGRLFPLVDRGLDAEVQKKIREAMEELSRETTARVAESSGRPAQA